MTPCPQQARAIEQEHTSCRVVRPWRAILPPGARAAELARAGVEGHRCPEHGTYAAPALGLLVEELVRQLAVPGTRWVAVELACDVVEVSVTVSVVRSGPALRRATASDVTWRLVDKVARRWDRHRDSEGESVWCAVPTGVLPTRGERPSVVPGQRASRQAIAGWTASQPA